MVILPALVCTVLSFTIFMWRKMDLERVSALMLLAIYLFYIYYNFAVFGGDSD